MGERATAIISLGGGGCIATYVALRSCLLRPPNRKRNPRAPCTTLRKGWMYVCSVCMLPGSTFFLVGRSARRFPFFQ